MICAKIMNEHLNVLKLCKNTPDFFSDTVFNAAPSDSDSDNNSDSVAETYEKFSTN